MKNVPQPSSAWTPQDHNKLPPLDPRYGPLHSSDNPIPPTLTHPQTSTTQPAPPVFPPPSPANRSLPPLPPKPPIVLPPSGSLGKNRLFFLFLLASMLGALTTLLVMHLSGGLFSEKVVTERVIVPSGLGVSSFEGLDAVAIAEKAVPAIVHIEIETRFNKGSGSGVIIRDNGTIMTNNHVVQGARKITVWLPDGRMFAAEMKGADPTTDIAILKIDQTDLPIATIGSTTGLKIGQPVMAIGNPLGLEGGPSVSTGIISAKGRQVQVGNDSILLDMIQTDAAISPGSSGGALLDANGSLIGITTAIGVSEAGAEGIGFATPINIARSVSEDLLTFGEARHPFLGVAPCVKSDCMSEEQRGAPVGCVKKGYPADQAGLRTGDVITSINGEKIRSFSDLRVVLRSLDIGQKIDLTANRSGEEISLSLQLTDRPQDSTAC